jgi:quercetin dioxygenase-like cupin family protein
MATLVKKNVQKQIGNEKISVRLGLDRDTLENAELAMGIVTIAPGGGSARDYHIHGAQCIYVVSGNVRWFIGPYSEVIDMEAGDFLYIPKGEIHGNKNLSDTEPVVEVALHLGVDSFDAEGTIPVEHLFNE